MSSRYVLPVVALLAPSRPGAEESRVPPRIAPPLVSSAVASNRTASVPDYADALPDEIDWLDFGLESRSRLEFRDQEYRSPDLLSESAFYQRSLLYLGIRERFDPLRLAVEFEDSRRGLSERPDSPNEENHQELLQAYGGLQFDDLAGGEPVELSFGRMAFDAVDRRLLARNRFRNTINAFDGARLRIGDESAPVEWDVFALRPVARSIGALDRSSGDSLLYGAAAHLRSASPGWILEPYWLLSDQAAGGGRRLHTTGAHFFGQIGDTAWDYDFDFAGQWGEAGTLAHRAWAAHAELGHSWKHPWKPRLGAWVNYASGDRDPTDASSGRFDPLYGASFAFYGYTSYFLWQNMLSPCLRLSFQPTERLRCEILHRGVWLASESDGWVRGARSDPTGRSGRHLGQELDLRASWHLSEHLDFEVVYACFFPGDFVSATGPSPDTHFGYLSATLRF